MDKKKVEQFVNELIQKWRETHPEGTEAQKVSVPVITVCMEPGSGGSVIAKQVASEIDFNFFHHDMIKEIADSAQISEMVTRSLEKDRFSGIRDFISLLVNKQYIWPGIYLNSLMDVVNVIAEHGRSVIVGRGVNFIIPQEKQLSVRVVAPMDVRVENVSRTFGVTFEDAKRRILRRESRRRAFVRQSFNRDISNPVHYDMIINTGSLNVETAVQLIIHAAKDKTERTLVPRKAE